MPLVRRETFSSPDMAIFPQEMREPTDPEAYWPVRLGKGLVESGTQAATLPGDVYTGKRPLGSLVPSDTLNFSGWAMPINPAIRAGDRAIPGVGLARSQGAPSESALRQAAGKNIEEFRSSGVYIKGDRVSGLAGRVMRELDTKGFLELDAPSTYNLIKAKLADPPPGAVLDTTAFHSARKALGRIAKKTQDGKPTPDAAAALVAMRRLDEFFDRLPNAGFMAPTPAAIAKARADFADFRGNYAAAERSKKVTGLENRAELNAIAANSGANIDNALRQQIKTILADPRKQKGYSPEEIEQMRHVVGEGATARNALRVSSNLLGGGGGLGALAAGAPGAVGGAMTGSPELAAFALLPVVGAGLKAGENALARRSMGDLDEMIRSRSPLARKGGPYQGPLVSPDKRAMLLRLLPLIAKSDPEAAIQLWQQANPNSL